MQDFRKLKVWERSHELTLGVYRATVAFPKEELYGLTSQMRRACSSIPANIAEGCGRASASDLNRFLHIAAGSASELQYHLHLARDLGLLSAAQYKALGTEATEVKRMLWCLIEKVKPDHSTRPSDLKLRTEN